ncbi:right-handed parallel beta-helix repeat-containing protein [Nannocystis punicea]|uniref:Right-handed parallel beta-helix repeat-containing protein n=1 Tax=Nannocystis punicea TaxID=2995304 RepID=A0ABY7H528_9BACT|nr:right-handed parallel beta-helix repeat-containing protein [Nannocystis poenicansa]WAS94217.1 right-handed parallel beta-helix repeat-containing protein [Nannocystis poenicansa]
MQTPSAQWKWFVAVALTSACGGGGGNSSSDSDDPPGTGADPTGGTMSSPTSTPGPTSDSDPPTTTEGPTGTSTGTTEAPATSTGEDITSGTTTGAQPTECADDNCHYVRAGASGSGADWDDASPELPAELQRGHVYFVAAGSYPAYQFDDAEAGDQDIRVLRASAADHGTDVGWDPGFAAGEAVFGELRFTSGRYEFDGRDATRVVGGFESTVVDIAAPAIRFLRSDVDGAFAERGGKHTGGACTAMNISGDDVVVAGNRIHDAADDGVSIAGLVNLSFTGNVVHALHGCGTDGDCGPCYNGHSDGLELYDVADSEIVGNMIYDVASTAAVFFGNWADELGMGESEYCENVLLANNILYSPETGFVAYIEDARGIEVLNNVIWGLHQGAYGGLSIGVNVSDLDLYNNVILSINYTHIGGEYDPAEHRGDYNLFAYSLGQWQDGPHDIVAEDPQFSAIPGGEGPAIVDPAADAFAPAAGSPLIDAGWPGDADIVIPEFDFFGQPRGDAPDIGAIE